MKIKILRNRMFKSEEAKRELTAKLRQLTDASNLPEYMGELFLSEIIESEDEANKHLRERVVLLGLGENA